MTHTQRSWVGHVFGDRYKVEEWIAQGGMSTVYKAIDPNLRRTVAIKLIHPHLSSESEFLQRFEQEATAVAQLRHPNIVQVYDFDHDGDVYYMVLEYVLGETLQARLKALNAANRRLPLPVTAQIMATVCDAVDYAHQHGMIHRDLKPANVMLNRQGQPILMDFGVAKMVGDTHFTATGTVIGTALYMSPEQARGERPDERADIYSLGVMLFEMIGGRPPFEGDSAVAILLKHVNEPVPDLRQLNGSAPEELVAVVETALAKDPAQRFQTAAEMAEVLRSIDLRGRVSASGVSSQVALATSSGRVAGSASGPAPAVAGSASGVRSSASGVRPSASGVSPSASGVRPAPGAEQRSWAPWLISAATALIVILVLGAITLFVAWRFARPLILAKELTLPSADAMVKVNGGVYLVGQDEPDSQHVPPRQVKLNEFWIDQYEVMNAQYAQFLADTNYAPPTHWPNGKLPAGQEAHPAVGVTWDLATAYCQWAKKRLPSEAEWEVAARGPQRLLYPWGDDERSLDLPHSGTYTVGSVPTNRSPLGAFDMAGNVWEWVGDTYAPVEANHRVLRGGANGFLKDMAYRLEGDPQVPTMVATAGFRCAADQVEGGSQLAQIALVAPLAKGVLLQDRFTDPNSGWPVGEQENGRFGYHPAAFYHVEVSAPNDRLASFRGLSFGDFTAEVDVLVDHTDTQNGSFRYGLALRRSGERYYAFTIAPRANTWQVLKSGDAGLEVLAEGALQASGGLHGVADRLRVDAAGPDFTFIVNDQAVGQVHDADYLSGDVGFAVETFDETLVHIHYAALTIRELEPGRASLLSQDDFADPNSGWPVGEDERQRFGYHPPDFFHLETKVPNDHMVISREPDYTNVTAETKVLVDHTETQSGNFLYGLALRRSGDQYYAFGISPRARSWQALKSSASGLQVLAEGSLDIGGDLAAATTLRVDAVGPDFTFKVNGQDVTQVHDADYASGQVGFFLESFDEILAHVHYDTLSVRVIQ